MVMQRKISTSDYVIAGIITILVFSLGLSLGIIIDNARYKNTEVQIRTQELDYNSLQFQSLYLSTLERERSCPVLQASLKTAIFDLSESLEKVISYGGNGNLANGDYEFLRRRYLLDNLRYWLLAKETKKLCGLDTVSVLYFYEDDCDDCPNQGVLLSHFKNVHGDRLLIFPIDTSVEGEPLIKILQGQHNVHIYPSIIVESFKFEGLTTKEELEGLLCRDLGC
ncbi:MAG: hypothetical protein QF486_06020 [Candidatus Woesearchaeota archaeon]|jgi:hypothetical protein|nr:hypothetical protein [Candidatus Woesearchaeota archaeon]MDP7180921.1 hypothetical protein [Candidatus Woesearchaeota archaeon]MDP7199142.1 hypothetical protein [Candidatus Woesearchaeota archaeon]MDP7467595.1 hypothetical protein [Candidatus Woesearchaeota archaeon]MDP7647077.1 hypothetical protein [Candidatus Woesearchaeota archaeon]|tara:strand:+ start:31 stop:702 length:672 start_codon:yes stop_codon:yes gene_type:complete